MKCFLLLLACLAAANAHSYYQTSTYSYVYYCRHQFHVLPPTACYHYTIYFPSTWCSHSYYSNILKVYPGDRCLPHWHCWSERSVSSLTSEVRNLLAAQRTRMCNEMYAKRDAYFKVIDSIHAQFNYWFKTYLYRYYTYRYSYCGYTGYYATRNNRIIEYCSKLAEMRASLWNRYNAAISAKVTMLNEYHGKIVKAVETCLNTRLAKIAEFKKSLDAKINSYYSKFYSHHCSLAYKNYQHYREVLKGLFYRYSGDWWVNWKAAVSASYYYSRQKSKVYSISYSYRSQLYSIKNKLIPYYTCNYKCVLSSGCGSFNNKSYYTYCQSLGTWWCYKSSYCFDRYCLAPFKVKFTPCHYKTLKTCNVDQVVGNIDILISQLEGQRDQIIKDNASKYSAWRATWVSNFFKYKSAFWAIVMDRHRFLCAWQRRTYIYTCGYLSSVQISYLSKMKSDLYTRAIRACNEYYYNLLAQLARSDKAHQDTQQKFKDTFNNLISQLKAKFEACKSTRTTKIAEYKQKLYAMRDAQRKKLHDKFYEVKNAHWSKFHAMLRHYHGSCYYKYTYIRYMYGCYASHLIGVCNTAMSQFDSFWRTMIPKLVMHYACCYKCSVSAKVVPKYSCGYWYSWKYCLPTYSSYGYQYSCWYKYHNCIVYA